MNAKEKQQLENVLMRAIRAEAERDEARRMLAQLTAYRGIALQPTAPLTVPTISPAGNGNMISCRLCGGTFWPGEAHICYWYSSTVQAG